MAVNARIKAKDEFRVGTDRGPPLVYLDLGVGDQPSRRLHIELFHEELPITTENFRLLCTGELRGKGKVKALWYKNTRFHRVIPGFMMQGGDITHGAMTWYLHWKSVPCGLVTHWLALCFDPGNGAGGVAAMGTSFEDESFLFKHQVGAVSMAHQNSSNRSQFFICFGAPSWLDGKHVVLGQVLRDDLPHLAAFEATGSASGRPTSAIVVTDAGQVCGLGFTPAPMLRGG
ncbi:Peptidyl-prolyl cis-trans isomerase [Phytophthora cinnamomi]|uniref:Peptidyl-prolyl cis-trans isomerase n=1 Tax=Phytophthora cinnamomi TaxID=4785 RepID=UPI00355A602B|nr:Peptidyl-prolyl cis-trans isomerase [Phytophthora cinnamomi]